jgi:hypothetical protein
MTAAQKTAKDKFKKAIAYRQKTGVSLKEAFAHIYGKKVGAVKKKSEPKKKAANMKIAKYKVGQKVYSYQNKDYSAPINKLVYSPWNNTGIYDKRDTYKYVLSLKDGNSNFIDEKSISVKSIGAVKKKAAKKVVRKVVKKKAVPKKVAKKKLTPRDYDKRYSAKKPGKRTSATGNTYYENRANRSDRGKLLGIEGNLSMSLIKRLEDINKEIEKRQDVIANVIQNKTYFVNKNGKSWYPKFMKLAKSHIAELKKHKIEIKKLV